MHTGETWRLGRRPALDGLRGVAVLLVVIAHSHVPGMVGGGATGVAVFFTLSGFLITAVLLQGRHGDGRLDLGAFYLRRVLRLGPALLFFLAIAVTLGSVVPGAIHRDTVLGTLGYATNWLLTFGHNRPTDWLGHTWSLSVEEQFYLLWPLSLGVLLRFGRAVAVRATVAVIVLATLWRAALWTPGTDNLRIYFGTDTRADGLLIGCLLALVIHRVRAPRAALPVGLGLIAASVALGPLPWWILVAGPTITSVGTALVILAVVRGGAGRLLGGSPLVRCGGRSYAVYLWHYPAAVVLSRYLDAPWPVTLAVVVGVAFGMAEVSWRYVEEPFLRRARKPASAEIVHRQEGASSLSIARHGVGLRSKSLEVVTIGQGEHAGERSRRVRT